MSSMNAFVKFKQKITELIYFSHNSYIPSSISTFYH